MSYILTEERVALALSDKQSTLEISATDEIHMEDQNHGLAWTKPNSGIYNTQTVQRLARKQLHLNHVVSERPNEE